MSTSTPERSVWLRGEVLLLSATAIAVVWANSPWVDGYRDLWTSVLTIGVPGHGLALDLRHWINDGLMSLFFFAIALEIKREVLEGQLATWRRAATPVAAALGGMVVPALVYVACNAGRSTVSGWGIPMATDVAFALGLFALLGPRVPSGLRVLLLGLAIVDDIGAIVVIAVVYADRIDLAWLGAALGGVVVVVLLRRAGVRILSVYVVVAAAVWLATFESGIHATFAGVVLGLLAPARGSAAVTAKVERRLTVATTWVVLPLFAVANAGIAVSGSVLGDAARSPVTLGVTAGLVVGKFVGVAGAIGLATRLGVTHLPHGITTRHVLGMAATAGIGFTVSLFVTDLAFTNPHQADAARIGVLTASMIAAAIGAAILGWETRHPILRRSRPAGPARRGVRGGR